MPKHNNSTVTYIVIDLILVVLTIATVALSFYPETAARHLLGGLAIAIVKAALVVMFFMHARRSSGQTKAVIAVTIFWLAVVMLGLTLSDYSTRGLIPNMPGH